MYRIESVIALTLGTTAATVPVKGMACLIENNSAAAAVYFKERRDDGADASASNGWLLPAGTATSVPLTARDLSLVADAADTDVRVLLLERE